MLLPTNNGLVQGMLVEIAPQAYSHILGRIDQLERYNPDDPEHSIYFRVLSRPRLWDGAQAYAWVYVGQDRFVHNKAAITSGSWLNHISAK